MGKLSIGDIVTRKSYGSDILFRIADIKYSGNERIVLLKGIHFRIEADAPEPDIILYLNKSKNNILKNYLHI